MKVVWSEMGINPSDVLKTGADVVIIKSNTCHYVLISDSLASKIARDTVYEWLNRGCGYDVSYTSAYKPGLNDRTSYIFPFNNTLTFWDIHVSDEQFQEDIEIFLI